MPNDSLFDQLHKDTMHESDLNKGTFKSKWTDHKMVSSKFKDFNIENHPMLNLP